MLIFLENLCVKIVVAVILLKSNNKAYFRENVNLYCYIVHNVCLKLYIMFFFQKLNVIVTTHLQSLLYLCLVLSYFVKHNTRGSNQINP